MGDRTRSDGRTPARAQTGPSARGQAHTLEAVAAALLLISAVVFALQVTAVTPLSGSTSNQHIENQQGNAASDVLESAARNGTLRPTLLHWNHSAEPEGRFHGASREGYRSGMPPTTFGDTLEALFLERGIAVNVELYYTRSDNRRGSIPLVYLGEPSDHASTASWFVTLLEDDELRDASGTPSGTTVAEADAAGSFYADPDTTRDSPVFNVVEVEVTLWRL